MTRILIVDDRQDNLYYLGELLRANGFDIDYAHHGAEALSKALEMPPDVIVSDLLMPVMDGYTLLRHWKADSRLNQVPFVVYTATYTEPEDQRLARDLGADAFILKPSEPRDFLTHIRETLSRRSIAAPESPRQDESELLQAYSASLVRKLEEKMLQAEASHRALQADIAARKLAEAARDEAQTQAAERAALLDALFDSVPDAIMQLDLDGAVRVSNRPCALLAAEPAGVTSWLTSGPPEHKVAMERAFRHVITTGHRASLEISLTTNTGSATYWNTLAPILRGDRVTGAVVVIRDITERKQIEAQLMAADRMASVGNLAASVAHEINSPLMCVTANLPLIEEALMPLRDQHEIPADVFEALNDAREGAARVRVIVRDLRIFSREDDEKRVPVDVEQVLESTLRMARSELRNRARLVKSYARVPAVDSNESRLGQVFLNLIVNAVQAFPEGKYEEHELRVETRYDEFTRRVIVSISDTGSGIPAEIQSRLFKPFVTTKPPGVGTGLGLSICHRIVNALGGSIDFTSAVGRGTTFRVSLPSVAESSAEAAGADYGRRSVDAGDPARFTKRARVLVMDDDDSVTQVVRRGLAPDHDVESVSSVAEAMKLFRAGERYDVVLCDLVLSRVTGMELYRTLSALDSRQAERMIFMTGGALAPRAQAFLDNVPNPHLEKPFELEQLRALIQQLSNSGCAPV